MQRCKALATLILITMSTDSRQPQHIVIVGGGLAGMAAAAALVQRGCRVTLLESRNRLGGRASSFLEQSTGTVIDNCQHVNMGCGTNFAHFCAATGIADAFRTEECLYFIAHDQTVNRFRANWGPAPFHLLGSLLRLSYLTWSDKLSLGWALRDLAQPRQQHSEMLFSEWLRNQRQSDRLRERFWSVVLVSALSETVDRVTVSAARKVFVDGFLAHRKAWEVQIPTVPLDELYTTRVGAWLQSRGVAVRLSDGVQQVENSQQLATGVHLRSGEFVAADAVVLAVMPNRLRDLLPREWQSWPEVESAERLPWSAIASVHLWTDRPISPLPHAVLLDRLSQWYFGRGPVPGNESQYISQVVISASHAMNTTDSEAVRNRVWKELQELWPMAREARLIQSRLVTEHRAALSCQPGTEALRPGPATRVANLYWAGDWIKTGWPSTMEGAVRSGYLAAEAILGVAEHGDRCLQPDLEVSLWSKWLYSLS